MKRKSKSPDRRDEASERADQSRQGMAETDLDTPMPPTVAEIPTPFGPRTGDGGEAERDAPIPPAPRGGAGKDYEQMLSDENATASGDETFMVEGTLKVAGTDDIATEGKVVVIRYKSRWPAKESLDGLTEEAKERSGRGFFRITGCNSHT